MDMEEGNQLLQALDEEDVEMGDVSQQKKRTIDEAEEPSEEAGTLPFFYVALPEKTAKAIWAYDESDRESWIGAYLDSQAERLPNDLHKKIVEKAPTLQSKYHCLRQYFEAANLEFQALEPN